MKFSQVEIREYRRCISDNPSVSSSLAVGLDWHYLERPNALNVDDHEREREERQARRRRGLETQVWLSPQRRRLIIEESEAASASEVAFARKEILRVRRNRFWTLFWVAPTTWLNLAPTEVLRGTRRAFNGCVETAGGEAFAHWSKKVRSDKHEGSEEDNQDCNGYRNEGLDKPNDKHSLSFENHRGKVVIVGESESNL